MISSGDFKNGKYQVGNSITVKAFFKLTFEFESKRQ